MKRLVIQYLLFLPRYLRFAWAVLYQQRFLTHELLNDINVFVSKGDATITAKDINKITNYYALGVPAVLGTIFSRLRGKQLSRRERLALTYLGAITGLFDDLFDRWNVDPARIYKFMDDPSSIVPANDFERLFLRWYEARALRYIADKDAFREACGPVFAAQKQSLSQLKHNNSGLYQIKEITYYKGGVSVLFYRSALRVQADANEKSALNHAGALLQLGNDIFDTYKDLQAGVKTLATETQDIRMLKAEFMNRLHLTLHSFNKLDRPLGDIQSALHILLVGVSRCLVCLDQLQRLQDSDGGVFRAHSYERKHLICDMEKPVNIVRMLHHHWSLLPLTLQKANFVPLQSENQISL
jgi:hypothetical protein